MKAWRCMRFGTGQSLSTPWLSGGYAATLDEWSGWKKGGLLLPIHGDKPTTLLHFPRGQEDKSDHSLPPVGEKLLRHFPGDQTR